MPLTDKKIQSLKSKAKPYKVADFDGLYINVSKAGSRLWRFKYRFEGKEGLLSFGAYPAVTLKEARDKRDAARSTLAKGVNPSVLKNEKKAQELSLSENTFNAIADAFFAKAQKEGRAKATLNKLEWLLLDARRDFGTMPIRDINATIILKTLKKREALDQHETSKRMRSRIGGVFRYAVANGLADNDPTFALRDALIRPIVTHRAAITDRDTLKDFLNKLDHYSGARTTIIAMKLLMLFAARTGELRHARWHEFDFEAKVWHVPAERMKMRKPHSVPLSDAALALLNELKELTGWGELLFPAQTSSKKPISENPLNQALRRMGFGPNEVTSHGFRTTFSTFANESGLWSGDAIEAYLSHQDKNVIRRTYNRAAYWDERVKIADWWAAELNAMGLQP